jgi:hypothetical protein
MLVHHQSPNLQTDRSGCWESAVESELPGNQALAETIRLYGVCLYGAQTQSSAVWLYATGLLPEREANGDQVVVVGGVIEGRSLHGGGHQQQCQLAPQSVCILNIL